MYREALLDCVYQIWKTEVSLSGSVTSSHVFNHTAVYMLCHWGLRMTQWQLRTFDASGEEVGQL